MCHDVEAVLFLWDIFYDLQFNRDDRPQRKFAKVMFLHLSVSHSVHKGACVAKGGMCVVKGGRAWQKGGACVAGEAATAAGGMHPTGMHSSF